MDANDGKGENGRGKDHSQQGENDAGEDGVHTVESEKLSTKKAGRNSRKGSERIYVRNNTNNTSEQIQAHVDLTKKNTELLCEKCEKTYGDEGDMLLSCEYCGKHTCISCLGMSKTVYKNVSGRKDMPWFCSHCLGKSLESIKQTKSIEDRCNDFLSRFQTKVESRLEQIAGEVKEVKSAMLSMKDEIMNEVKQLDTSQSTKNTADSTPTEGKQTPVKTASVVKETIVKETASELQSRLDRRNNIALFNMKENESNLKEECVRLDKDAIQELCSEIGVTVNMEDIKQVKRIGKKGRIVKVNDEDIVVPRIMIVTCTDESKAKIMKSAHKLAGSSSDYFKKIGIKHDMTREEREQEAKLKEEAKEKNKAEQSKDFVYLVKGLPWERRIVKIRKGGGREAASKRGAM